MSTSILATKLFIPQPRTKTVLRSRLIDLLNEGLHHKLTLISAPAGFGKTTLVSEWIADCGQPVAWLSLDEGDNDPTRFLAYLVAALQTIAKNIGESVSGVLQSPQPPPVDSILTTLLNDITTVPNDFVFIFDDYHVIDSRPLDSALAFLIDNLPPQMHLVIATREDPQLSLARLRARNQLTELRANDLRFTPSEAAGFLNQVMGLKLSAEDIAALETRTEGWIAGLQLAAISMQGHKDATGFIRSFTGSHHFVMDYLVEEVLHQQSESVQAFLLRTSILDRLCGPLCDAVLLDSSAPGQETLEYLEHSNLFIIPLDNERRWYRYHHLFADLLRQRLLQSSASSLENQERGAAELHIRASLWYENNGLEIEAFRHATVANDVELATRLMEGDWMPLPFRGAVLPVLNWLKSLSTSVLDAIPLLWVTYASTLLASGQLTGVEQKLQAAEVALKDVKPDDMTKDLVGRIAATRATLAAGRYDVETIISLSRIALENLHPENLSFRTFSTWKLGFAYELQGDRVAAARAYTEAISVSQASGNTITTVVAAMGLGCMQEQENQLYLAAETFKNVLQLFDDQPLPMASIAHLGLARIYYEWNDLDAAQMHGEQSAQLARLEEDNDRIVSVEVLLARLKLAQGDVVGTATNLDHANQLIQQHHLVRRTPQVAAAQVVVLLHQGKLAAAEQLAENQNLHIGKARVYLARGDASAAMAVLEPWRQQVETKGWQDDRLKVMVLQAVALNMQGEKDKAVHQLADALALAEPGGFVRIFVDEGVQMAQLLSEVAAQGAMPDYTGKLLAACNAEKEISKDSSTLSSAPPGQPLVEPLSQRELEVLRLIAQGFSNQEICQQLFLALSTVKGHNRNIYGKLQVQRRTEAIARARELGLL